MYFDGHFVTSVPGTRRRRRSVSGRRRRCPGRPEEVRHGAFVDDRDGGGALHVAEPEVEPGTVRIAADRLQHAAGRETVPAWPARELGRSDGVPPPAIDV